LTDYIPLFFLDVFLMGIIWFGICFIFGCNDENREARIQDKLTWLRVVKEAQTRAGSPTGRKLMTAQPAGIEPLFSDQYIRKVRSFKRTYGND